MKNREGALVIEASIALTSFMFFILFFMSFAQVYQAQSLISHASFQTSQTLAVESFAREKVGENGTLQAITKLTDFLGMLGVDSSVGATDSYRSLGKVSNLNAIIKKEFAYSIADSEEEANSKLVKLGIKDGINGLSFDGSTIANSVITISVNCTIKLNFAFFGKSELQLTKKACSKSFAKISEDNMVGTIDDEDSDS